MKNGQPRLRYAAGRFVMKLSFMGAMPMKAVLRPAELRKCLGLLSLGTICALVAMLFRR